MKVLLLSLVFLSFFVQSQEEIENLSKKKPIKTDLSSYELQESRGFLILYPMSHLEDSLSSQLQFPDLSHVTDTAYAEIYFTGNNEGALTNSVMTIIGNYKTTSPTFWIDYNNDLDFSESTVPIRFEDDSLDVKIPDTQNKFLHHSIRFYKLDSTKYHRTDSILSKHITGGKHVAFYFDQRLNIMAGDFIYDGDSIRIGVMDYNVNGAYNDLNEDRIVFGQYKDVIDGTDKASGAIVLEKDNYFNKQGQSYKVEHVEADGSSITIVPLNERNSFDRVKVGDTISDYTFATVNGKETSVRTLLNGENYLYLNFWASWCAGCHMEMQSLEKVADNDAIIVVSLNYNERQEAIDQFIEKYHPSWIQGRSTEKMNRELMIEGLPRNILIAPDGRIEEMNIHPSRINKKNDKK